MSIFQSKLSNYTGQVDPGRLRDYLTMVDADLYNLFNATSIFHQFGTGNNYSVLTYTSTNYVWFPTIGTWNITESLLYGGSGSTYIGLQPSVGIWLGDAAFNDAVFSVDPTGQLKAHGGNIAGWVLTPSTISSTNLILDSTNERIETSNFVSGAAGKGWRIDKTTAEFGDIRARGKITCSVFEKETLSAVGGNIIIMDSDVLTASMSALDTATITISGSSTFMIGDFLRIKDASDDEWFEITGSTSAYVYNVTRDKKGDYASNSNPTWEQGVTVVNYGVSGEGGAMITSSEANSPYMDFFTHAGAPWTTTTAKTRIGNLAGIAGASGYGIWAGSGYLAALQVIDTITMSSSGSIRSNLTGSYPYLELSQDGMQLKDSDTGGTYGTAQYSTDKYGYGALAWIFNSGLGIPWAELKEPSDVSGTLGSIRLYNRSNTPTGLAVLGDMCVANGKLYICTTAGSSPASAWTVVGAQS